MLFRSLFAKIHLADNQKAVGRDHQDYDNLYKIRQMMSILKKAFQENYNLGQNVSIDEAIVKGKGRNPVKQYMPMKPIKRGSKLWCIGCSCCAYLRDFHLYAGKEKGTGEQGLSSRVVCDLCHPTLDNRNHVIYMDNFFTSIGLCKKLKGYGTYTVGTLRSNRVGYPKCLTDKAMLKKMKRGDYHSASSEGITVTVWKDTKDVSFLTNVHSSRGDDRTSRKKQDGTVHSITAPTVVKDYNNNMGAIDKNDQLKKTYSIDRKSKRWWMRIFSHLFDICRLNAFIMHQQCYVQWNSGPVEEDVTPMMDQKAFTSSLVKSLCGNHTSKKQRGRPSLSPPSLLLRTSGHESVNIVKAGILKRGRCAECCIGENRKRARVETVYGCLQCNVRLCRNKCHDLFHSRLTLPN